MSTLAANEPPPLILLLLGTNANDDAAVAASSRACTWTRRRCVDFEVDIIVLGRLELCCKKSHTRCGGQARKANWYVVLKRDLEIFYAEARWTGQRCPSEVGYYVVHSYYLGT